MPSSLSPVKDPKRQGMELSLSSTQKGLFAHLGETDNPCFMLSNFMGGAGTVEIADIALIP